MNKHYANRNRDKMWRCLAAFRTSLPFLGPAREVQSSNRMPQGS